MLLCGRFNIDLTGMCGRSRTVSIGLQFSNNQVTGNSYIKLNKTNHGGIQAQSNMTEATVNGKRNMKRFAIFEHVSGFRKSCTVSTARMLHLLGT